MEVEPSYAGILSAARIIGDHLPPTPAWQYPLLDAELGCRVLVKHENIQPTGAFKVRGGLNLASQLDPGCNGLVTASTGNHAQSIAYAARTRGTRAVIVMPTSAPRLKINAVRALGAEIVLHGPTMTEAVERAIELAEENGWRYVDPGQDPAIIHGHGTVSLELLQTHPDLQTIYVPVGSGTGAAGACLVRDQLAPGCRIVGVQSAQAPAAYQAWRSGDPSTAECSTRASGLATAASFEMTQRIMRARLDDFILVDDSELDEARRKLAYLAHTLAEGAGAAALAGLLADANRPEFAAIIVSGGNADTDEIASLASR